MLKVAIIDDGIPPYITKCFDHIKVSYLVADKKNVHRQRAGSFIRQITHAGLCFLEYASHIDNMTVEVFSIKVIDRKERWGDIQRLVIALKWCIDNDIKIINLSVGSTNYFDYDLMKPFLEQIDEQQKILIASHSNKHIFSYPAASRFAIGVRFDSLNILPDNTHVVIRNGIPNNEVIYSKSSILKIRSYIEIQDECNSFAAPLLSAEISKLLSKRDYDRRTAAEYLQETSLALDYDLEEMRRQYVNVKDVSIPIILITSKNNSIFCLLEQLTALFKRKGYCVFSIVHDNVKRDIPYIDLELLLKYCGNNIKEAMLFMQCYSNADIILVQMDDLLAGRFLNEQIVDVSITDNYNISGEKIHVDFLKKMEEESERIFTELLDLLC